MNKEQLIINRRRKPIAVGDKVDYEIPYLRVTVTKEKNKRSKAEEQEAVSRGTAKVVAVISDPAYGTVYGLDMGHTRMPDNRIGLTDGWKPGASPYEYGSKWVLSKWVKHNVDDLGANPFLDAPDIMFYNKSIESLLHAAGYNPYAGEFTEPEYSEIDDDGRTYGGINFDPYVTMRGMRFNYQRPLVWGLAEKRALIDTIYSGGDIGKFVLRYKTWNAIELESKSDGHGYSRDCIDGKQRFHAILCFIRGEFADSHGNHWYDLSKHAQRKFLSYNKLAYGELGENSTDQDAIDAFMHINVMVTPQSETHLLRVKNIQNEIKK